MTDHYFFRQTVGLVFLARFLSTLFLVFYVLCSYVQLSKKHELVPGTNSYFLQLKPILFVYTEGNTEGI